VSVTHEERQVSWRCNWTGGRTQQGPWEKARIEDRRQKEQKLDDLDKEVCVMYVMCVMCVMCVM